jgi:cobalt-zinc-cadmium efflux system outer membrane protein
MPRTKAALPWRLFLLLLSVPLGCSAFRPPDAGAPFAPLPAVSQEAAELPKDAKSVQKVVYNEAEPDKQAPDTLPEPRSLSSANADQSAANDLFARSKELSVEVLIAGVLARNPTLAQMVATWKAVQARYPQVTSLDDPILGTTLAPAGLGTTGDASNGYRIEAWQKLPWRGKLALRGENVQAQARAAANDVADIRLQLIESAKTAFYDYYLVARAIEINEENLRLLRDFRGNAESRYRFGLPQERAPLQDILQADVEIGRQKKRSLTLERMRLVAVARINTLLNRDPDVPLPPPPKKIDIADNLPDAAQLRAVALARRPDLRALADRIQAEEAALALAYKEFYPDFDVMAAYDAFWVEPGLRPQLALRMNLPVRLARRRAAVWEAKAKIAERRAELDRQVNQMNYEINQAYAEVMENKQAGRLYEQTVVPKAEENVRSAQAAYKTGKIPFLTLVEAERDLIRLKDEYYEFVADYYRRLATLERAAGGSLSLAPAGDADGGTVCSSCSAGGN